VELAAVCSKHLDKLQWFRKRARLYFDWTAKHEKFTASSPLLTLQF